MQCSVFEKPRAKAGYKVCPNTQIHRLTTTQTNWNFSFLVILRSNLSSQIIVIIIVCQGGNDFFALLLSNNEAN